LAEYSGLLGVECGHRPEGSKLFSLRLLPEAIHRIQKVYGPVDFYVDDMVMKIQGQNPAFVDGLYAKFYALSNELLCVGPKCS